jgi:hypothetical protein
MEHASMPLKFNQEAKSLGDVMGDLHKNLINWCVYRYADRKELALQGSGTDGLEGAVNALEDANVNYAMVRFQPAELQQHGIANASTEKYLFVQWTPNGCPPLLLGAVNSHRGAVKDVFSPQHLMISAEEKGELSLGHVMKQFVAARIQS